jgi:hypothetical protein
MQPFSWLPLSRTGTLAAAALFAVAISQPLTAQTGSLQGRVTDSTGAAIIGTNVTVDRTSLRTIASRGAYTLNGVPAGRQIVRVRALGFAPESASVDVVAGAITTLDVRLHRAAQRRAAVVVVTGSRARR